jgi:hypothetical protein
VRSLPHRTDAYTPAAGWKEGQVENQFGVVRERVLRAAAADGELRGALNAWLLGRCVAYAKAHNYPELTDYTIWQAFVVVARSLSCISARSPGLGYVAA